MSDAQNLDKLIEKRTRLKRQLGLIAAHKEAVCGHVDKWDTIMDQLCADESAEGIETYSSELAKYKEWFDGDS